MPPPLPSLVVPNSAMKVSARVGANPVPIDLLESEVLWGWGVARQIASLPLPFHLIKRLVDPALSLHLSGIRPGKSGKVTSRSFSFPFHSCARPCLPPCVRPHHSLPFPVPVCSLGFPCLVCFSLLWFWGTTLVNFPRYRHDTRVRSALRHSHCSVLYVLELWCEPPAWSPPP